MVTLNRGRQRMIMVTGENRIVYGDLSGYIFVYQRTILIYLINF